MHKQLDYIIEYLKLLQTQICERLETIDGSAKFISDIWERPQGGGGDTRVISEGEIFEKGGVNFSHVHGEMPEVLKNEGRQSGYFHATGVSIVIHPLHPYVPIIHMNIRYFLLLDKKNGKCLDQWIGGGIDMSPAFPNRDDAHFFHHYLKKICDVHDTSYYTNFKAWCDSYFTIQHRQEMRGIGGIFYDHLRPDDSHSLPELFAFMQAVGNAFTPIYEEIIRRNRNKVYSDDHKKWQYIRRGRYAEFNLVYDRGTHFGLKTNGRIESILMSLPPTAQWHYDYHPSEGSEAAMTLPFFQPQNWM